MLHIVLHLFSFKNVIQSVQVKRNCIVVSDSAPRQKYAFLLSLLVFLCVLLILKGQQSVVNLFMYVDAYRVQDEYTMLLETRCGS